MTKKENKIIEKISFIGSIQDAISALKIGRDGMRFTVDVAESELPKALPLVKYRGKLLEIEIREL